jgi:UDP-N-acetylmuramate dehydrogenase
MSLTFLANASLKAHHTFGVEATAALQVRVDTEEQLMEALHKAKSESMPVAILGSGSNVLPMGPFAGMVVYMAIRGIKVLEEDDRHIHLRVGAGTNWHGFVQWAVHNGFAGIENLALIPGTVGAAPMQNIGAYGLEVKSTIEMVHALEIRTFDLLTFENDDCGFGYRTSVFKTQWKDKLAITDVDFVLSKDDTVLNTSYPAVAQAVEAMGMPTPRAMDVAEAVAGIRRSKLPNWRKVGNAGSFFKNPTVSEKTAQELKAKHPELPVFDASPGQQKLSAAWLIEQAGYKEWCVARQAPARAMRWCL